MPITRRQLTLSTLGSGLLSGCAGMAGSGRPAVEGDAAMSAERLARIAPAMDAQLQDGIFPGAVTLVAHRAQVVHFEAHGFLDAAKTRPMPRDAIFRLASMTKPTVSVATMMLIEQGQLKLNDPIAKWLPELKDQKVETAQGDVALARPVTVQDLLAHTAGLVYGGASPSPRIKAMYSDLGWGVRLQDGVSWVPGSKGDAMRAGAWGTSFWIDPQERLVGILMAQSSSNRIHTRMLYKNLVYGALVG